ncbi:midnolin isoform X2 [Photinus pyralis]|uniref:Ubiquitin-like domain-containing protein n=1 Tax=Photinus pyralis TaxID=7054 RepID=A0A1Y1JVD0_PHOPY|nr:midnolin isoform X2 [Photinus pyralis]
MEDSAESNFNPISQGCGPHSQISIQISPTTGGDFHLTVDPDITVENVKKLISKRLKVPRDRICLLFRDKQLQEGNLLQHGVTDGSKVTLLPNVETGLVQQRPEIGIMQALESLNDTQVNEFLCGKAPLNLSMRLGDHMMLIQLQLSTVSGAKPPPASHPSPPVRPPSLTQASRNLQHTLRRLSADVFSGRSESTSRRGSVYSGTFSGALNPALQDPKAPELRRVSRQGEEQSETIQQQIDEPTPSSISEDQNSRTRGKLEHLRLVMGERRERRRQRKQKPYSLPQSDTDTVTA